MKTLKQAIDEMRKMSNEDLLLRWQSYFNEYDWFNEKQEAYEQAMRTEIISRMGGK